MTEQRKSLLPWILIAGGAILLLAGLFWVVQNPKTPTEPTAIPASVEQVERVSLADSKAAFDAKEAIFLDVRATNSYEASHIPGAVSIPLNELPNRAGELDPDAWILPY